MLQLDHSIEVVPIRNGRPPSLTPRTFLRIIKLIEAGWSVSDGCRSEGLSYRRFRQLCQNRPNFQKRYEKAIAVRQDLWHDRAISSIMEAGEKSWMAHAWYCERVWPEKYALKTVERTELPQTTIEQHVRVIGLPESEILKLVGPEYTQLDNGNVQRTVAGLKIVYAKLAG
jgi:hypothetical protein